MQISCFDRAIYPQIIERAWHWNSRSIEVLNLYVARKKINHFPCPCLMTGGPDYLGNSKKGNYIHIHYIDYLLVIKHGNGKSPTWMQVELGKSVINGAFSLAMFDYWRVIPIVNLVANHGKPTWLSMEHTFASGYLTFCYTDRILSTFILGKSQKYSLTWNKAI